MTTEKQSEANRQNALQSTGPKSPEGIEAARFNALRHGIRSVQTIIPGEDPQAWEAHRAAVVEDLKPEGAVELALAEQIAVKLWRLGRVVRFEANVIGNSLDPEELAHSHEKAYERNFGGPSRTDIPTWADVASARKNLETARKKARDFAELVRQMEELPTLSDEDTLPSWDVYSALERDLGYSEQELDRLFKDVGEDDPLTAGKIREMLALKGDPVEGIAVMAGSWRIQQADAEEDVRKSERAHKRLLRRYEAALARLRGSRGLPDQAALDRIQRYESHLERGLHKTLERLQTLQEARGAIPSSHKPAVAVAVIQPASEAAGMGSFGSFAVNGETAAVSASN